MKPSARKNPLIAAGLDCTVRWRSHQPGLAWITGSSVRAASTLTRKSCGESRTSVSRHCLGSPQSGGLVCGIGARILAAQRSTCTSTEATCIFSYVFVASGPTKTSMVCRANTMPES